MKLPIDSRCQVLGIRIEDSKWAGMHTVRWGISKGLGNGRFTSVGVLHDRRNVHARAVKNVL